MIASIILSLYLLGYIAAKNAAAFLFISGVLMIGCEFAFGGFGILTFNALLAIYVGYMLQTGHTDIMGVPIDWSLIYGIAFVEMAVIVLTVWIVLHYRKKPVTTGAESMIGGVATVVEWKGKAGIVTIQGERWKAQSEKTLELDPPTTVTVTAIDGLVLKIKT